MQKFCFCGVKAYSLFDPQYHICKLTLSSEPLEHSNEPEIDEVEAALSNLEVTLEGGHTDRILVNILFFPPHTGVEIKGNFKVWGFFFSSVTVKHLFLGRWAPSDCMS